jgi:hypothetical protein
LHIRSLCLTRSYCWRTTCSVAELWLTRRKRKCLKSPSPPVRARPYRLASDLNGPRPKLTLTVTPAQRPRRPPSTFAESQKVFFLVRDHFAPPKTPAIVLGTIPRHAIPRFFRLCRAIKRYSVPRHNLVVVLAVDSRDSCEGVSRQIIGTVWIMGRLAKEVSFWHDEAWL